MSMRTGENEHGLKKIIDMTRMIAIVVLLIHCYYYCYAAFKEWRLTTHISDEVLKNIGRTGLLNGFLRSKLIALGFLLLSLLGVKGRKSEKLNFRMAMAYLLTGLLVYFISGLILGAEGLDIGIMAIGYMVLTGIGLLLIVTGGGLLTRIIKNGLKNDVFNTPNETFPQEERKLVNEFSFNLPAIYQLKGKQRKSWLNYVNPRRSIFICGGPGSGKTFHFVEPFIRQQIEKGYCQFNFDYKFPDLTTLAYNHYLKQAKRYPVRPRFYSINFTNPSLTHCCNPLAPAFMREIIDAIEAARTIMLAINKSWSNKQGDFFVESPINLLAAAIWFLRCYQDGRYCTLPHAIELIQLDYDKLFTVLRTEPEIQTLINPFISAYLNNVMETLDSQVSSAKIPLGRLSSPLLYYIMSGNDFNLDINNPQEPKIVCLGNDPTKAEALAPILSLYVDRMNKIINQKGKTKCATNYDEFTSLRADSVPITVSTGRGNNIVVVIALQDYNQLERVYGREQAKAIWNMAGNIVCGQVAGDSAKFMAERFPKTLQDRQSISINSSETSVSRSKQLEQAITASTISSLSSGEFVGIVADNPDQEIELKAFHCKVASDYRAIDAEKATFLPLPTVRAVTEHTIQQVYQSIKLDIPDIVEAVMDRVLNDPEMEHLLVKRT